LALIDVLAVPNVRRGRRDDGDFELKPLKLTQFEG
jgi:hypothetical protein